MEEDRWVKRRFFRRIELESFAYWYSAQMSSEAAKKRAEPYTTIVEELPRMRRETVHLVRQAVSEGRHAYVLVNNPSEGNAPLTVQALSEMLRN
jgi:uncharacterized protein YecE (DUF72 family)